MTSPLNPSLDESRPALQEEPNMQLHRAHLTALAPSPLLSSWVFWGFASASVWMLLFVVAPQTAHADGGAMEARKQHKACKSLRDAGKPCKALKACDAGLKAYKTNSLQTLRDEVKSSCKKSKKGSKTKRGDGVKKHRTKPPAKKACPEGQSITQDTAKQCCWTGQAWNGARCVGLPTSCPEGKVPNLNKQACTLPACVPGKIHVDGAHCCWKGQAWSSGQNICIGIPKCPRGFALKEMACELLPTDDDGDGLVGAADQCPSEPEDFDQYMDKDGCPDPDNDSDKICDPWVEKVGYEEWMDCLGVDKCPMSTEDFDGFEDSDGCPEDGPIAVQPPPPPSGLGLDTWGWISGGTGVTLLTVGGFLFLTAESQRDEVLSPTKLSEGGVILSVTETRAREIEEDANTLSTLGVGFASVGGVALITGITLLLLADPDESLPEEDTSPTVFAPSIGPDHLLMTLTGSF